MQAAGLGVHIDAVGNVVGRWAAADPEAPTLLLGSHIDTIRDAGRYDGNFGVLAALAAVEELQTAGVALPFAVEIVAFGDEEGVRFPATLAGSKALAGRFDPATLDLRDDHGTTLREALTAFGCDPDLIPSVARDPAQVLGFVEVHIEQGPVLEAENLPVGIVTAINGASRFVLEFAGEAGHAGTVPMTLRRDALAAAAEFILAVERVGRDAAGTGLVATVGRITPSPGAVNAIAGRVQTSLDVRAPDDTIRTTAIAAILDEGAAVARRRGVSFDANRTYDVPATPCHPEIMTALAEAVARAGLPVRHLASGAGHDTMALAPLCPVGMLFVRCRGGISHNPAESITAEDAGLAVEILADSLQHWPALRTPHSERKRTRRAGPSPS
jgi:allantoate deiminase